MHSRQVLAGGVRCHYLEAGPAQAEDAPPLVLLHGTAIDSAALSFGPSLPHLGRQRRTLALDWPGYGHSERPREALGTEDYVALLDEFLDALAIDEAHLVGFSMGGAVALGFALRSPARARTLTLIASYGLDDRMLVPLLPYLALRAPRLSHSVTWGMRKSRLLTRLVLSNIVFADASLVTSELTAAVHEQLATPEAERAFVAWLRGELGPLRLGTSYEARLPELRVPTLLLHGRGDRVVSWRKAARASRKIPGAKLATVPGCGHWLMREAPEAFHRELLAFTADQAES